MEKDNTRIDQLFERISSLIEEARCHVVNTVNVTEVKTRFEVGRYIFEDEQQGGQKMPLFLSSIRTCYNWGNAIAPIGKSEGMNRWIQ